MQKIKYEFGLFVLDPMKHSLFYDGREVEGAFPQDIEILLLLVRNAGDLVSRERLLKEIWNNSLTVEENSISSAVSKVRRMMRKMDGVNRIKVVSKRGFRFLSEVRKIEDLDKPAAGVKESAQTEKRIDSPLNDRTQIEDLRAAVSFVGDQIRELVFLVKDSTRSIHKHHDTRFNVTDICSDEEQARAFFGLVQDAGRELTGAEQNSCLDEIESHHADVLKALHHYADKDSGVSRELEMVLSLARFWDIRGYWTEGKEAFAHALARQAPGDSDLKAKALARFGYFLYALDDYKVGEQILTDTMQMSRRIGDRECFAFASNCLALIVEAQGRYGEAESILRESLRASRAARADVLTGWILRSKGLVAEGQADYESAKDNYLQALYVRQHIQDLRGVAAVLNNLGSIALIRGDHSEVRRFCDKSLELSHIGGNREEIASCYFNLGLAEKSNGNTQAAKDFFRRGLVLHREVGDKRGAAKIMEAIAMAAVKLGDEREAARIFGNADAVRFAINAPLSPADQKSYGQLRDSLKKNYLAQWNDGGQRPADDLII